MPLQPPTYIGNLDSTNPRGTDPRTISDDVHRNIQESCRMTLPNLTGEVTADHNDLNTLTGLGAGTRNIMTGTSGSTVIFMYNNTPPVGWTLFTIDVNIRALMIGSAAAFGGNADPTAFNHGHSTTSNGFTLYAGGHTHTGWTDGPSLETFCAPDGLGCATRNHTHNVGMTTESDHRHVIDNVQGSTDLLLWQPRYAQGILVELA